MTATTKPAVAGTTTKQNKQKIGMSSTSDELQQFNPAFWKKYVVNLQGKDFMTYNGLIAMAKEKGLLSITTKIVQFPSNENGKTCIVEAEVIGYELIGNELKEVHYVGIGDANVDNCNRLVGRHFIRMAETRAKGRALRDFLGIDMVMSEELGGDVYNDNESKETTSGNITDNQMKIIGELMKKFSISKDKMKEISKNACGTSDITKFTADMADHLINIINNQHQA